MSDSRTITVFRSTASTMRGLRSMPEKLLFNAPRPLPGHDAWNGTFFHGAFYAEVDPKQPDAEHLIRDICSLDGWLVVLSHPCEVVEHVLTLEKSDGYDFSEESGKTFVDSWWENNRTREYPLDKFLPYLLKVMRGQ